MRIETMFPVRSMSGTYKTSNLVYATIQDITYARLRVNPANPSTEDQVAVRACLARAVRWWGWLTMQQRRDWDDYARAYKLPGRHYRDGRFVLGGLPVYVRASVARQILGLDPPGDAPLEAPPGRIRGIEQVAAAPDRLCVRLHHDAGFAGGLQAIVRATRALNPGRRPPPNDHRYVCGVNSASARALPESGDAIECGPVRFAVEAGQRFGVEVRVVRTADGMISQPAYGDFVKEVGSP